MSKNNGKLLITGGWEQMIENLMESLSDSYRIARCGANERDFRFAFEQSRPSVVVVCLSDESGEVSRLKTALENTIKDSSTPVMIMGHDEECQRLTEGSGLRVVETFGRPLDTSLFWNTLAARVEQSQQCEPYQSPVDSQLDMPEEYTDDEYELMTPEQQKLGKQLIAQIEKMATLHGRMSVLVVDDDVRMLNAIKLYLQDLYDVTVVPTGRLAIKFLSQKHADMVLLDYMMPVMDGPTVLKFIREESPCPQIPVLFLTGVSDKERIMTALDNNPNGYLLKPVTRMTLLERVTELLLGLR